LTAAKLKLGDVKRRFSATVDKDKVISSSPAAGSKIAPGRTINLVVSKGFEPVQLDNVLNQNFDQAKALLESKGLNVEKADQDFAEGATPQPGTVVAQDPQPQGQQVAKGSTVKLTVIKVPEGQGVIPDVRGKNFDEAKGILEGLGFKANREGPPFLNRVNGQDAQGLRPLGTEVKLFVGF
jgi:beta-lactam-binding protein with PASTA domain